LQEAQLMAKTPSNYEGRTSPSIENFSQELAQRFNLDKNAALYAD
jgi:hypothetical protein